MGQVEIRRIEQRDDGAGLDGLVSVCQEVLTELDPSDPPMPPREVSTWIFDVGPDRTARNYLASVDGVPAGIVVSATVSDPTDELQVAEIETMVRPKFRGQGIATGLLRAAVPDLIELDQTSLLAFPSTSVSYDAAVSFCHKVGMTKRNEERCSRATVADVDDQLLEAWTDSASSTATGYRIECWEGHSPPDLAEQWSLAGAAMKDAPLDDLDYNPYIRDVETRQQIDELKIAGGYRIYRSLAIDERRHAAGMSEIFVHEDRPQLARQHDTAVLADHRGHRLGRWLKAANYQQVRAAHPELEVVETINAESNPWMLDINVAMGFRPHHTYHGFQGDLTVIADALGVS